MCNFISYSNNLEHTILAQIALHYYETFLLALMFQVKTLPNLNRYNSISIDNTFSQCS